jgi:hypothetical protein
MELAVLARADRYGRYLTSRTGGAGRSTLDRALERVHLAGFRP